MNKGGKKEKKEAMMATWSDSDHSSSNGEPKMEAKANLCLMIIDDEVCIDELDDLQNEYECLFKDWTIKKSSLY